MNTADLANERAFAEVKRLCLMGLDPTTLRQRVAERMGRAVPFEGYVAFTMDPTSGLITHAIVEDRHHRRAGEEAYHPQRSLSNVVEVVGRIGGHHRHLLLRESSPLVSYDRLGLAFEDKQDLLSAVRVPADVLFRLDLEVDSRGARRPCLGIYREIDPDSRGRVVFLPELQQLEFVGFRGDHFVFLLLLRGGAPCTSHRQLRYGLTLSSSGGMRHPSFWGISPLR